MPAVPVAEAAKLSPTAVPAAPRQLLAWWPGIAAVVAGALLVGAFAPFDVAGLAWVALVPLIAAVWWAVSFGPGPTPEMAALGGNSPSRWRRWAAHLRRRPGVRAAVLGYLFGLVFFGGAFSWLTTVTVGGTIAIACYFATYTAVWAWFLGRLILGLGLELGTERGAQRVVRSRWNLLLSAAGAAAWVAHEWVRGWLFSGWGWNGLGVALHGNLGFIQVAEWTGVGGLSFLLAWANLMTAATLRRFYVEMTRQRGNLRPSPASAASATPGSLGPGRSRPHFDFTLTLAGVLAVFMLGQLRLSRSSPGGGTLGAGETRLRVAAVQAAIPQFRKWDRQFQQEIWDTYRRLTDLALAANGGNAQLLLWPEASTPQGFLNEQENFDFVQGIAGRGPFNFLLGTVLGEPDPDVPGRGREFNAAAIFTPGTEYPAQIYRKVHLVPFGEYIPLRHSFPLFGWIAGNQVPSDFDHGDAPAVFQLENPDVRAAPLICFEDTLGELVRRFVLPQPGGEAGAGLLVNVTNDGWFRRSAASAQQLHEAVFRTVENRRPMVRCANTGVTCFVDTFGRVTQTLRHPTDGTFGPGVLVGDVIVPAPDAPLTFYTRHGEFFAQLCAGVAAAVGLRFLLAPFLRRRR